MTLSSVKFLIIALFLNLVMTLANAANLQRGLEAYQRGDYAIALAQFEPLAEQGDAVAQFSLGVMYDNGEGVIQDYEQAFSWFRRAAEQGHPRAQGHLGRMYFLGRGVEEDLVQAYIWFNLAVAQGDDRFGLSQKSRKLAEEKMTEAELKEAQEKSWDYMAKYVEPFKPGATGSDAVAVTNAAPEPPTIVAPDIPQAVTVTTAPTEPPAIVTPDVQIDDNADSGDTTLSTPQPISAPEPLATPGTPDIAAPTTLPIPEPTAVASDQGEDREEESSTTNQPSAASAATTDPRSAATATPALSTPTAPQALSQPGSTELAFPESPFPQTSTPTPVTTDSGSPVSDLTTESTETTEAATAESIKVSPPEPAPTTAARQSFQPSPNGRFRVQLASLSSQDKASGEQQRLQRRYSQLLGNLTFTIQSANLDQGIFHRIQAGPLSYSSANSLCEALKRQNQACVVVNR